MTSDGKITVLYFTVTPLSSPTNGGSICCRTHVQRLAQDPRIDLRVVAAHAPPDKAATESFLQEIGVPHLLIPLREDTCFQTEKTFEGALRFAWKALTHFPWEMRSLNQPHVDEAVLWATRHWQTDVAVVDYLFSGLFCPSLYDPKKGVRTVTVTLNREAVFYDEMIQLDLIPHDPLTAWISKKRLASLEKRLYLASAKVISIGAPDLPSILPQEKKQCITPYLDEAATRWSFSAEGANNLFFVGNLAHYPNRLAIEYIATELAPRVAARRRDVRFQIIGADPTNVPPAWRHPQVDYLGIADGQTVENLFASCGAMLCPVKNDFGMKFKAAQAVSYGSPLLASPQTLKCLPFLAELPPLSLEQPEDAARLVCSLAGNEELLTGLHRTVTDNARAFALSQQGIWSSALFSSLTPPAPHE